VGAEEAVEAGAEEVVGALVERQEPVGQEAEDGEGSRLEEEEDGSRLEEEEDGRNYRDEEVVAAQVQMEGVRGVGLVS
jgi:hypothetical protein